MSSFENLRVVDNFYQTSLFFPMPTVVISTLCEDGSTTLGPYSLVQPYYVAGKDYYALLLECRNSSNTAQNLIKHKKCTINFLPDDTIFDKTRFKEDEVKSRLHETAYLNPNLTIVFKDLRKDEQSFYEAFCKIAS